MELPDWLRAFGIVGETPTGYALVRLTEDGDLYSYLVGDYEGSVVPVTLDAEGRISAFVVDSSDVWEQINRVGNADLAARLGSGVIYDQRGRLMAYDDFRNGLGAVYVNVAGGATSASLSPVYSQFGGYSLHCDMDSIVTAMVTLRLFTASPFTSTIGICATFSAVAPAGEFRIRAMRYDGTQRHLAAVRVDFDNDNLDFLNSAGVWETLDDSIPHISGNRYWQSLKVVVNFDTDEFVRALYLDTEYDLSGEALGVDASAHDPGLDNQIRAVGDAAQAVDFWIDRYVLTSAEP